MPVSDRPAMLKKERPLRVGPPPVNERRRRRYALAWGITLSVMLLVASGSWIGSAYVTGNPEVPANHALLERLGQLPELRRFSIYDAPQGRALDGVEVYSKYRRFLQMDPGRQREINRRLMREFLRNYRRSGPIDYVSGDFRIEGARALEEGDFMERGVLLLARSLEIGALEIEYLLPGATISPGAFREGDELSIEGRTAYAAVVAFVPLGGDRLRLTLVPLVYGTHTSPDGGAAIQLEPPAHVRPGVSWPLFEAPGGSVP